MATNNQNINKSIKNFEEWNEHFVEKYDIGDYYRKSNFIVRFIERKRIKTVIKLINSQPEDNIIELGCGAGHVLIEIPRGNLTGIDLSEKMLESAQKRFQETTKKIVLIRGDVENLPEEIKNKKFDKIICSEVIEHVLHPDGVIDEILKIARPNSIVVISIPNERFINNLKKILIRLKIFLVLFPNISKKMDDEWHLHSFSLDLLRRFTRGKLKIKEIKPIPLRFFPIRYVVKFNPQQNA